MNRLGGLVLSLLLAVCVVLPAARAADPQEAPEGFRKLDINQDGRLSGTEISDEVRPLDANRDGRVTLQEFTTGSAGGNTEKQFQERDINKDGVLSGIEQRGVEKFDVNTDGDVTKAEFLGASSVTSGPSREELLAEAEKLFTELDVNRDYKLSGSELSTVPGYDQDADGKAYLPEVFEGHETAKGAGWKPVEFAEFNMKVKLPATPEQLPPAGPTKMHAATEMDQPAVRFEVRVSEAASDVEGKAEQFFTAVKDRLTASKMEIIDEDEAPLDDHPGVVLFMGGTQGDFHVVRAVLIGKRIYELEAIYLKKPGQIEKFYGQRFLESLSVEAPDLLRPRLGLPGADSAVPPPPAFN